MCLAPPLPLPNAHGSCFRACAAMCASATCTYTVHRCTQHTHMCPPLPTMASVDRLRCTYEGRHLLRHAHGHDPEARHARKHHAHERVHHPEAARREDLQQRARDRDERLVGRCMAGASSMVDSNTASVRLSVFVTGVRGGAEQQKEARPAHPKWPRQLT